MNASVSVARVAPHQHVGSLLRQWRRARGVAQLTLACEAAVSTRHLSYVESGRATPSRALVLRLCEALQMPLRERNTLLLAAGYAPQYRETDLDTPQMAEARRAVDFILAQQEPYPAIVLDAHWNLLATNAATRRFLALFPQCAVPEPANGPRLVFHPRGLRPFIANWEEVASRMIQRLHREAAAGPGNARSRALLDELLGYPGVPDCWHALDLEQPPVPFLCVRYRHSGTTLSFFSTITTFGTAQDVTLQELRIECFFPADDITRSLMIELAG
ncbi:MAG TPA: helix-turn-helix transcriptional regulator [Steroidobacteraceae bacterium]|nr:helix-turn-helix transcriptional regulator [Steroidobacteraceae bacterium]